MVHAKPAYRPGLRRRIGHTLDLTALLARTGLITRGSPVRTPRQIRALRRWGTTLAGLTVSAAARAPGRAALVDENGALTYAELDALTDRLAAALPLSGPRPRVGVLCRNHRGMVKTLVACSKRGAEVVLLNTGFGVGQLRAVLGELRVNLLVVDAEFADLVGAVPPALRRSVLWADRLPDTPLTGGALAWSGRTVLQVIDGTSGPAPAPPQVQGRTIMLSSGTTGRPKGARRPPRPGLWPLASMVSRIPLRVGHTVLIEAPLFHTWGHGALQMAFALRSTVVLRRRFEPTATLASIAEHPDVVLFTVPVMLQRVMDLPPETLSRYGTSSLRMVIASGAALPGDLATRFMDAFGDRLYSVYGTTETSWVSIATPRDLREHPGTAGRPPRNTSLALLGERDEAVPRATIGRIFAANEMLFEGYTSGEPMEVRDGLLCTGDLGHLDTRGLLYVDGRIDGLVVSGGENVVPRDVEDALARLPQIREAAVIGVPDTDWGQRLAAYVVLRRGAHLDAATLCDYVHDHVARYAVPRDVHFIDELPRNATGKVVHRWLADHGAALAHEGRTSWTVAERSA